MAAPTNYDQTNDWLAQVSQGVADLVAILKGGVDVGQSGTLGDLSLINTLSAAPMGDPAALRANLQLGEAAMRAVVGGSGNLMAAGAFGGFGGNPSTIPSEFNNDANTAVNIYCAFYSNAGIENAPPGNGTLINIPNSLGRIHQIYLRTNDQASPSSYSYSRRYYLSGVWTPWITMRDTSNTTVDGNGYVKAASPIFRLAGQAEVALGDGFTADGCGAYNPEAEGVTAVRDSEGVYRVLGSLGFATEGWTIVTPQGDNGENLVWIDTDQQADGTIIVRTYHRTHPNNPPFAQNNIPGYDNGDPIDIPEGRWIDLRLSMPELEQQPLESSATDEADGDATSA